MFSKKVSLALQNFLKRSFRSFISFQILCVYPWKVRRQGIDKINFVYPRQLLFSLLFLKVRVHLINVANVTKNSHS